MSEGAKMRSETAQRSATSLRKLRWGLRYAVALGVTASITANVLHAQPRFVAQVIAGWAPLALLLTIELISRVPVHRRSLAAVRMGATSTIAGIAAWVSYWHMVSVCQRYGETGAGPYLLPLSVDGLVVVAAVSLVEVTGRLRNIETGGRGDAGVSATPIPRPAAASPAVTPPPAGPSPTQKRPAPPSRGRQGGDDRKAEARRRYAAGEPIIKVIASWPEVERKSQRTVEVWTADLRAQHAEAKAARDAASTSPMSGVAVGSVSDRTVRSGVSGSPTVPVNGAKVPAVTPPHRT